MGSREYSFTFQNVKQIKSYLAFFLKSLKTRQKMKRVRHSDVNELRQGLVMIN